MYFGGPSDTPSFCREIGAAATIRGRIRVTDPPPLVALAGPYHPSASSVNDGANWAISADSCHGRRSEDAGKASALAKHARRGGGYPRSTAARSRRRVSLGFVRAGRRQVRVLDSPEQLLVLRLQAAEVHEKVLHQDGGDPIGRQPRL
jgi:hypothetical protein